ncbi:MAG: AAA family ATPase, partial [Lachnospiraceae bacterium]|nr:AAA family ATPase [Lachnospiraceae bacterium]
MKINGLYPGGFGKLKDREIRFDDGINIIYGQNEAGKSTLRNFLTAMLFGWEKGRAKADPYKKYRPWDAAGIYGGAMDLTYEGREYRVERDFTEGGRSLRVYLQPSMREIPAEGGLMEAIGSRVTRAGFENTAMVPQGSAAPGDELSELYGNYIANLALSKDREVDVPAALAELSEQRKALEKKKLPEKAAELRRKIGELETLMAELDRTAAAVERLRAEKATIEGKLTELSEDRSLAEEQQLAEYLREYDVYCEELERRDRLAEEIVQTERKQTELLDGIPDVEELEQTEKRVDSLLRELVQAKTEWKSEREKFAQQETELRGRKRRKALLWIPGLVLFAAAAGLLIASLVKKTEKLASLRPYALSALVIGGGL